MTDFKARFTLFRQEEKRNERSPDYSGNLEIPEDQVAALINYLGTAERSTYNDERRVKIRLGAWVETSKQGKKYFSGQATPQMGGGEPAPVAPPASEEMPF